MKRPSYLAWIVVATAMVGTHVLMPPGAARAQAAAAPQSDDIDPDSIATLNKMGAYLRSLKAFQVESVITRDEVMDDGQQVKLDSHVDLLARMPDRLRAEVKNARQHRLFLYNGTKFTLWAQRVNYYATVPAPPTIAKLAYGDGYYGGGCCYHPVATAAAVTATAMVTAAVIGSVVNSVPPSCTAVMVNGMTYQQCGSTWYRPQFVGTSTS